MSKNLRFLRQILSWKCLFHPLPVEIGSSLWSAKMFSGQFYMIIEHFCYLLLSYASSVWIVCNWHASLLFYNFGFAIFQVVQISYHRDNKYHFAICRTTVAKAVQKQQKCLYNMWNWLLNTFVLHNQHPILTGSGRKMRSKQFF